LLIVVTIIWLPIQTPHARAYTVNQARLRFGRPGIFARSKNWVLRLGDAPRDSVFSTGHGRPGVSRSTGRRSLNINAKRLSILVMRRRTGRRTWQQPSTTCLAPALRRRTKWRESFSSVHGTQVWRMQPHYSPIDPPRGPFWISLARASRPIYY